ncbi:MAG: tetratricopeptide repeat protein [Myxococcales bacterium]|nr:tetratricopeptide repeat protein [Myxococcales bacterium]
MVRLRQLALVVMVLACARAAQAQTDDPVTRARTHFEAGRALYQLGNYDEALREFAAGYQLVPRPQFLLNLGQCYRRLDELENARAMYQRYLHDAPPTDLERSQAQQILAEIDKRIADRQAAAAASPATVTPLGHSATALPPSMAAMATLTQTAPAPRRSWITRNWWIIPAGAVVVGVAIGLGSYYGTRAADPCSGANLTCWDLSK